MTIERIVGSMGVQFYFQHMVTALKIPAVCHTFGSTGFRRRCTAILHLHYEFRHPLTEAAYDRNRSSRPNTIVVTISSSAPVSSAI